MGNNDIWVYAETIDSKPVSVCYELIGKALELKKDIEGAAVVGILLGDEQDAAANELKNSGCDSIITVKHEKLAKYDVSTYAEAFEEILKEYDPMMLLMGATAVGAELAPTVAARMKTGLAAHCVDICKDGDRINCMVPAFGGRVISEIYVPDTRPAMASVRPGILPAYEGTSGAEAKVTEYVSKSLDAFESPVRMISFKKDEPTSGIKLEDAEIVVCAGRGVTSEEAWDGLKTLADKLGAAVGYTRSFVDSGFVEDETDMIGTSGKSVKPQLFLGFGISGASHHTCGMNKSNLVITVNKNENAKMFSVSDYGIVGDAKQLIEALVKRL